LASKIHRNDRKSTAIKGDLQREWVVDTDLAEATDDDYSGASALGKSGAEDALRELLVLCDDPDAKVRLPIAQALPDRIASTESDEDPAICALMKLMNDASPEVRSWATFGLGNQTSANGPVVRAALIARLDDDELNPRDEALRALVDRRHPGSLGWVLESLNRQVVSRLSIESAEILASPLLLPALDELTSWWDADPDLLERARHACSPETIAQRQRDLFELMRLAEAASADVVFLCDWPPIHGGDPQVALANNIEKRWFFRFLLERANGGPAVALSLIEQDSAALKHEDGRMRSSNNFDATTSNSASRVTLSERTRWPTSPAS
jgi:hypothetical protein